ncbi:MAG: porin [Porphyromonadaceae bacterium]|nr:porin [Porphyromonadaceae bacterium]
MKRRSILILFIISFIHLIAAKSDSTTTNIYIPNIEGTIRAKYEYNSSLDAHRFQVRNARFSVNGNITPITSYKAEIDLSDEGITKMLDAYVRLKPYKWFNFTIGQQKIPFGTDNLRSPHLLYFANRSFVGKQLVSGLRDVGATVLLRNFTAVSFDFQAGVYNGDGLYDQKDWQKSVNYVLRLEAFPTDYMEVSLNYNSIKPEDLRMNFYDVGAYVDLGNLHLEGEFIYKTYANDAFPATKSYSTFAAYDIWTNKGILKKITPLVRFDSMTDNNKGKVNSLGEYQIDDIARKRLTSGFTFSFAKPFVNDIRLNYEKYFFAEGIQNEDDKVVLEFVVRF